MSDWFPVSKPREVKGGIKAQNQRGAFGKKWWGRRWIEILEKMNLGGRLQRARSYARSGQVKDLEIRKGEIVAKVQGSQKKPYQVSIRLKTYSLKQWIEVIEKLLAKPIYAAQLLNNEMPADLEQLFSEAGCPLFPSDSKDLVTSCSCPDWSNPCKHIAAIYYLMSESFDQDPFLLLRLRGMDRESFLEELRGQMPSDASNTMDAEIDDTLLDHHAFWRMKLKVGDWQILSHNIVRVRAALPKRLGAINWWRGEIPLAESMDKIYSKVHDHEWDKE